MTAVMRTVIRTDKTDIPSPNPDRAVDGVKGWRLHLNCGHALVHFSKIKPGFKSVSCHLCEIDATTIH
jgi:hypothetical protein